MTVLGGQNDAPAWQPDDMPGDDASEPALSRSRSPLPNSRSAKAAFRRSRRPRHPFWAAQPVSIRRARTSFALFAATSALEPSRSRTVRIVTGLRATCPRATAQSNNSLDAANSRSHLAPPIRLGLSGDRCRQASYIVDVVGGGRVPAPCPGSTETRRTGGNPLPTIAASPPR